MLTAEQVSNTIDSTLTQLLTVQEEKMTILTALAALSSPQQDLGSVSSSGTEGSESYSRQTLTNKVKELSDTEAVLTKQLDSLYDLYNRVRPYVETIRQYL